MKKNKLIIKSILLTMFFYIMSCSPAEVEKPKAKIINSSPVISTVNVEIENPNDFQNINFYSYLATCNSRIVVIPESDEPGTSFDVGFGELTLTVNAHLDRSTIVASSIINETINSATKTIKAKLTAGAQELQKCSEPKFSFAEGIYSVSDNVLLELTSETEGAKIYYTIDGSTPSLSTIEYSTKIGLSKAGVYPIKAIAIKNGFKKSSIITKVFTIVDYEVVKPVSFSPTAGTYSESEFSGVTLNSATTDAKIYYTIDGSEPTESSALYNTAISLSLGETKVKAKAFKAGVTSSGVAEAIYTIQNGSLPNVDKPTISTSAGEPYSTSTLFTIATSTGGAEIRYTIDGTNPSSSSTLYSAPFNLPEGTITIQAIAYKSGFNASTVSSQEYQIGGGVANKVSAPIISMSGSAPYTKDTLISISSSTSGATIYYTTDGSQPSVSSNNYSTAFKLAAGSYTVKAIAIKDGMTNSDVASKSVLITTPYNGIILYYKANSAPTIWTWEVGGIEISKAMGGTWPGPTMSTVTAGEMNDPTGWFKLEIPSAHLTGKALAMKFNAGSEVAKATSKTGWYDNGTWTDTDPSKGAGPVKPTISASPIGKVKGTTNVVITIASDVAVTAKSGTFNGTPLTFTSNTLTVKVSEYINDKSSGTLEISATNSAGTSTQSFSFNRDDNAVVVTSNFTWDNANVYFVITDRFKNGNTSNDQSYGRKKDYGSTELNTGTFHGGDIAGLTMKLNDDYFTDLGVNVIWVTAPYEQVHGWCGGGSSTKGNKKTFPHYAYHGYYPMDFTNIDKNMGTVEEFRTFVNTAHSKEIRVIIDIVMNHVGYNTLLDMEQYNFGGFTAGNSSTWTPSDNKWDTVWTAVDWNTNNWGNWWSNSWIAAGLPTYVDRTATVDQDPISSSLDGLPDVRTETTSSVAAPPFLKTKWAGEASGFDNWIIPAAKSLRKDISADPATYITKWLAAWVEEFGIDGFRVDTAKHVQMNRWAGLKDAGVAALNKWRQNNPTAAGAGWTDSFWMTGEHWNHGVNKSDYFTSGKFDSIINFQFPKDGNLGSIGSTWASYASQINSDPNFNVLSYLNSHDHKENYGWSQTTINHGTTLLLSPGGVQIYYGDENSRPLGPEVSDPNQSTRSDYKWGENATQLAHWQKVGQFRRNNPAVGGGSQTDLGSNTYGRVYNKNGISNKVVIKINGSGASDVSVVGIFADGTSVRNAYDGATGTVSGGKVNFTFSNSVILVEEVK